MTSRSLKEQEQLLENCLQSNEINKSSMCETIYEEKEQVYFFLRCKDFYNTLELFQILFIGYSHSSSYLRILGCA